MLMRQKKDFEKRRLITLWSLPAINNVNGESNFPPVKIAVMTALSKAPLMGNLEGSLITQAISRRSFKKAESKNKRKRFANFCFKEDLK